MAGIPRKYTEEQKEEGFRLFISGKSLVEIADAIGVPYESVKGWRATRNWVARKHDLEDKRVAARTRAENAESKSGAVIPGSVSAAQKFHQGKGLTFQESQDFFRENSRIMAVRIASELSSMSVLALVGQADKWEKLERMARRALGLEDAAAAPIVNISFLSGGMPQRVSNVTATEVTGSAATQMCDPVDALDAEAVEVLDQAAPTSPANAGEPTSTGVDGLPPGGPSLLGDRQIG